MNTTLSKFNDRSSTQESHSFSADKNRSVGVPISRLTCNRWVDTRSPTTRALKFLNNSFTNRKSRYVESNCEIVQESDLEQLEERQKRLGKIKPILDRKEELLFHSNSERLLATVADRSRSTEITLPKVIESKDENCYIMDKPKHKVSNYLAMIDRTEKLFIQPPKTAEEVKEDQIFDSQNAIEEVNQCEEEQAVNDDDGSEARSSSVHSGSISRISNNSFIKRRIVDECVIFDREKEMSEIVT